MLAATLMSRLQMCTTRVLQPIPSNFISKKTSNFIAKNKQKIKDFGERLMSYLPPKAKLVDKAVELFKSI